jgi:hypothetical protein
VETGSPDELLEELLLLPPQALNPSASTPIETATPARPDLIASPMFAASTQPIPTLTLRA